MKFSTKNSKSKGTFVCTPVSNARGQTSLNCTPVDDSDDHRVVNAQNFRVESHHNNNSSSATRSHAPVQNSRILVENGNGFGHTDSPYPQLKVLFPGDRKPQLPDFIFLGCGTTSLPAQKSLTDQGYRVLGIEQGFDQRNNT